MTSAIEQAALRYGRRAVMLLGKKPAVGDRWPEWQATPENIRAWIAEFGDRPDANVGIRTGRELVVLDIDARDDGQVSLRRLEQRHGPLPPTAEVATGGGGRHLYFRGPADLRSRNLRHDGIAGVEIKAAGAQVVAPPSVHPETGREYVWVRPLPEIARLPAWVVALAGRAPQRPAGAPRAVDPQLAERLRRDPLHRIPSTVYVPRLTGRPINRRGFVACPIHGSDTVPSLRVYPGDGGWHCFGCGVGGGIYQLAGLLGGWPLPLSRDARRTIRGLLAAEFAQELSAA